MISIKLPYDVGDAILVDVLANAYEDLYSNYIDDTEKYASDRVKYAFKKEDLQQAAQALNAMELLAGYFTAREEGYSRLVGIRQSLEAKNKIKKMGG